MKIMFGKFKGEELDQIPDNYLVWLLTIAKPYLRQAVLEEIAKRFKNMIEEDDCDEPMVNYFDSEWWKD